MVYEWDDDKNRLNIAAHGIDFAAIDRFEWDIAVFDVDDRQDYGELREKATSFIGDVPYVVIFTQRDGDVVRIISLRKATRKERKEYENKIQG